MVMTWEARVEHWNRTFPKYPRLCFDKGWVYGVWYCGSFRRNALYGQYPGNFLERALALFPDVARSRILHCPSGTLPASAGLTIDAHPDAVRRPSIIADAKALPVVDASMDLLLSDPPYTKADSKKYGAKPYPMRRAMAEAHRVLAPGGTFALLHRHYPTYQRRAGWEHVGMIAVVCGPCKMVRMFAVFDKVNAGEAPATRVPFPAIAQQAGFEWVF